MDITLDKKSPVNAFIKIKLKEEDFQPKVEGKVKEYAKKASIKGFRPGKVPTGMIKKMYGKSILVEEINEIVSQSLKDYIQENEIKLIGDPLPDRKSQDSIDWDNPKELEFNYEIGMVDSFDLDLNKKQKVKSYSIEIDDKLLNETLENLKNQNGSVQEADKIDDESLVTLELISEGDSEEQEPITISKDQTSDKEFKRLIGLEVSDSVDIDMKKLVKDEHTAEHIPGLSVDRLNALSGKKPYQVTKINKRKPAELDQELFDKVFGKDAVKNEEEFIEKVKKAMQENYGHETSALLTRDIQEKLLQSVKIDLPDEFLKKWLVETGKDLNEEQVEKEYDSYARELKWKLINERIAKDSEIKIEHSDVIESTKNLIRSQFGASGIPTMEDQLDNFADNYLKGNEGQNYMNVYNQVQSEKVMDIVKEKIEIKEEAVDIDKFKKIVEN
ncbi:MAG: trigger factor [Bacteroidota bacterium]